MKYNLTTLKIYSKQGRKFKFFCQIGLKYRKIVFKYWKYILNTLKSVSKYIWFGKGDTDILERLTTVNKPYKVDVKVYKTTWPWLHFTYSVIFYQWPHTYSDCKTASIFAEVKNARVSGHTKSLEREGENGEWDWALQGVWGSRAFCENFMPAFRVFAKQIMKKKTKKLTVF